MLNRRNFVISIAASTVASIISPVSLKGETAGLPKVIESITAVWNDKYQKWFSYFEVNFADTNFKLLHEIDEKLSFCYLDNFYRSSEKYTKRVCYIAQVAFKEKISDYHFVTETVILYKKSEVDKNKLILKTFEESKIVNPIIICFEYNDLFGVFINEKT